MGYYSDFIYNGIWSYGLIPDWELVVLLLFLAIFALVCVMACIKCSQFACEESNLNFCPTCAANEFHIQRRKKKISTERTRLLRKWIKTKNWASFLLYFGRSFFDQLNFTTWFTFFKTSNSAWTILHFSSQMYNWEDDNAHSPPNTYCIFYTFSLYKMNSNELPLANVFLCLIRK